MKIAFAIKRAAGCLLTAGLANALTGHSQDAASPTPEPSGGQNSQLERMVVTGSNIPTAEAEGPSPVTTISRTEIEHSPYQTLSDLIDKLPQNSAGSFNHAQANGSTGGSQTNVSLRGLRPTATLVLVNGHRVAPFAYIGTDNSGTTVDLDVIPLAAVDHIEILKSGASAIYGSDAIAGVINIILKTDYKGGSIETTYGNTTNKDSHQRSVNVEYGTGNDKGHFYFSGSYFDDAGLFSRDRDTTADTNSINRAGGFNRRSGATSPGDIFFGDSRLIYDNKHGVYTLNPANYRDFRDGSDPFGPRATDRYNFASVTSAMDPQTKESVYVSGDYNIFGKSLTAFVNGFYTHTRSIDISAPTPIFFSDGDVNILVPATNPYNPFGVGFGPVDAKQNPDGANDIYYRLKELGNRVSYFDSDSFQVTGGLRGQINSDWSWETTFSDTRDIRDFDGRNFVSKRRLREAVDATDPSKAFNPFGNEDNSSAVLNSIRTSLSRHGESEIASYDAKLTGVAANIPAGPIGVAGGFEYRYETATDNPDRETTSFDAIGNTNGPASSGSRDVTSGYAEVDFPITSPTWNIPGFYSVDVDGAVRYEHYSDFGDTTNPKVSGRWQPFGPSWLIRGSYDNGFRAPSLSELFNNNEETFLSLVDPRGLSGNEIQFRTLEGGNPNLKPEQSESYNLGTVYSPPFIKGLTLSVDAYRILLRNVIDTDPQYILDNEGLFPGRVIRNSDGSVNTVNASALNIGARRVQGIDFGAGYELPTSRFGTFSTREDVSYLYSFKERLTPNAPYIEQAGKAVSSRDGSRPRVRAIANFGWDYKAFNFTVTEHYTSSYEDDPTNSIEQNFFATDDAGNPIKDSKGRLINPDTGKAFPAKDRTRRIEGDWTTDIQLSYDYGYVPQKDTFDKGGDDKAAAPVTTYHRNWLLTLLSGTKITFGVENLFDESPPFALTDNTGSSQNYDPQLADVRGRFYYVSLKKTF